MDKDPINNSDSSIESDEFINLEELIKKSVENIYQIQINNESLIIKHIGTGSQPPDMIIKENFGNKNLMNLYSCLYSESDFNIFKNSIDKSNSLDTKLFLPIIKLINLLDNEIYSISVNINKFESVNKVIANFDLYFTYGNIESNAFNYNKIESTINSSNIIEKLLDSIINIGKIILYKDNK